MEKGEKYWNFFFLKGAFTHFLLGNRVLKRAWLCITLYYFIYKNMVWHNNIGKYEWRLLHHLLLEFYLILTLFGWHAWCILVQTIHLLKLGRWLQRFMPLGCKMQLFHNLGWFSIICTPFPLRNYTVLWWTMSFVYHSIKRLIFV